MDPRFDKPPRKLGDVKPVVKMLCPFGCSDTNGRCNMLGYCQHLVGWTDQMETGGRVEVRDQYVRESRDQHGNPVLHEPVERTATTPASTGRRATSR